MANMQVSYLSINEEVIDTPKTIISYLAIDSMLLLQKIGNSNKISPIFSGTSSGSNVATVLPKLIVSWLEINPASISLPQIIGSSNKPIPRITGSATGHNLVVGPTIVSITPADGSIITKSNTKIPVTAVVKDNYYKITKVEIYLDSVLQVRDTTVPYKFNWNLRYATRGQHIISVKATNSVGKVSYEQAIVTVV